VGITRRQFGATLAATPFLVYGSSTFAAVNLVRNAGHGLFVTAGKVLLAGDSSGNFVSAIPPTASHSGTRGLGKYRTLPRAIYSTEGSIERSFS